MIKLTLNPHVDPKMFSYSETEIIIGNSTSEQAHFKIEDGNVQSIHLRLIDQGNRYSVINAANDPFTSLNGVPFGKKTIRSGDLLQIGNHTILFEAPEKTLATVPSVQPTMKQSLESGEDFEKADIDAIMREVELLEGAAPATPLSATPLDTLEKESKQIQPSSGSAPLSELPAPPKVSTEGQSQSAIVSPPSEQTHEIKPRRESLKVDLHQPPEDLNGQSDETLVSINWKKFFGFLLVAALLGIIIMSGIYFRASDRSSQEEKKIAAGTADIAMALVHAQLNHIVPNKQNWADPDFIQSNLACVLSPNLHSQAQIDDDGQFTRHPYILRVYTSSDLGRFLVIAQPSPSLLQWLISKTSVVIDSSSMEMRKISDLKRLNRLLANPNPLEGKNGIEISKVVKEGALMSLASLSGTNNNWGFPPPKALAYIRPGAENYIHNAPRYYPFGESILRKALSLTYHDVTSNEVAALQEEMNELSKFQELVLYTSQGLQASIEAQKAITTFFPHHKFLVGYVKFNPKGYVASSHIFMNDEGSDVALADSMGISSEASSDNSSIMRGDPLEAGSSSPENGLGIKSDSDTILVDPHHPLYLRLQAITSSRSRALSPLGEQIVALYNRQNKEIIPDFYETITELTEKYFETDRIHSKDMVQELAKLYQEYSEMPLEEFMKFIEASKLTIFIHEALKTQKEHIASTGVTESDIDGQINTLVATQTLEELDDSVQKTSLLLHLDKFPDPERLIILQGTMYNLVLDKLRELLLTPESFYARTRLTDQDRTTLSRILKTAWVRNPEESEYFLSEFDFLKNSTLH